MSWRHKYKVVGVKPGPIVTKKYGTIDLSRDDIPIKVLDSLHAEKFPYIEKIHGTEKKEKDSTES